MFDLMQIGRWIAIVGIVLAVTGGLFYLVGKFSGFTSFPGTLKFESSGFTCVFPLLGSIVLSIILTIVLNLLARIIK